MRALRVLAAAGLLAGVLAARAQAPTPDVYSQEQLLGMEKALEGKTDAAGLGTETLKQYAASDYTMLTFRNRSGKAELHEKFADFYVVLEGKATLVSGGQMVHGAPSAAGEVRGDSITGGKETAIQKGDVVHVPANIPHQLLLSKGGTLKYFVVKVQEVE